MARTPGEADEEVPRPALPDTDTFRGTYSRQLVLHNDRARPAGNMAKAVTIHRKQVWGATGEDNF
jgi:hypothetical protein